MYSIWVTVFAQLAAAAVIMEYAVQDTNRGRRWGAWWVVACLTTMSAFNAACAVYSAFA
jgi:hypothetical protein